MNISPSFSSSSPFDKNLKTKLICDSLTIVGVKPTDHEEYADEEEYLPPKLPNEEEKDDMEVDEDQQKGPKKFIRDITEGI